MQDNTTKTTSKQTTEVPIIYRKGVDAIPNGKHILRINGQNWPAKPYDYPVIVSDGETEQWVEFEGDWIYRMSELKDGSTFEPVKEPKV
jgi:hypothetical protein